MKATICRNEHDGKIASNRKEKSFYAQYSVVAIDKKGCIKEPVVARIYATGQRFYACVWINSSPVHISGGGYAGGYGYHKASAALQSALSDAGISLDESISGNSAMEAALCAVGKALGYEFPQIVHAYP